MVEPSTAEEYQMLHELELSMLADNQDVLFIKSRVYNLIVSFFSKVVNRKETAFIQSDVRYDQLMQAEMLMMQNIQKPPRVEAIARKVNLSVSSLFRQFKLIYGKSIYEYYLEKKMELAKKMMLEHKIPVNEMAKLLGYKQASPFIETFTRQHGCSPGALKSVSEELLFF
jgi:AraC-like DNA-binding protein